MEQVLRSGAARDGRLSALDLVPPVAFLLLIVVGWEVGANAAGSLLLPTFTQTVQAFVDLVISGDIWLPLARSNVTMVLGFTVAVAIGIPLGLLMGRRRRLDRALTPYVALLIVVPIAPLLPIVVMMVGFGLVSGVLVVVLFTLVYLIVNTRAGIRGVDERLTEMAVSYGAKEADVWRYVLLPGALPAIATGLRIGLGRSFAGMILAELLLFSSGIGLLILEYRGRFQSAHLFAVVLVLLLEAVLIGWGMHRLEGRLQRDKTRG